MFLVRKRTEIKTIGIKIPTTLVAQVSAEKIENKNIFDTFMIDYSKKNKNYS